MTHPKLKTYTFTEGDKQLLIQACTQEVHMVRELISGMQPGDLPEGLTRNLTDKCKKLEQLAGIIEECTSLDATQEEVDPNG